MSTLLRLEGIEVGYGDLTAVREVSLEVRTGEVVALIGGNGAGKTTTLRAITRLLPVRRGVIELDGQRLDGLSPSRIVARGLAHVPEGRQLFPTMTVRENLDLGAAGREARARRHETLEWVFRLFPRLQERNGQLAGTLSGGEQQMCAIGRALMARPKLLMLDEPSMGLAPILVEKIFEIVREINNQGTPILLVEQNALMALDIANRGYVMETGRIALSDDAKVLRENEQVRKAYLGEE